MYGYVQKLKKLKHLRCYFFATILKIKLGSFLPLPVFFKQYDRSFFLKHNFNRKLKSSLKFDVSDRMNDTSISVGIYEDKIN